MNEIYPDNIELMLSYLKLGPGKRFTPSYSEVPSKSERDNPNYKIISKDDKTLLNIIKASEEYSKIFNERHMKKVAYFIEGYREKISYPSNPEWDKPSEHFYQEVLVSTARKLKIPYK